MAWRMVALLLVLATPALAADPPAAPEAQFEGRTLSAWEKQLAEGKTPQEKVEAVRAITFIAPTAKTLFALAASLDDPSDEVKAAAIGALQRYGEPALPFLIQALQHEDKKVVSGAALALASMGRAARSAAVPLLHVFRRDLDIPVRERVAQVLAQWENRDAIPGLVPLLKHRDPITRVCAALALRSLEVESEAVQKCLLELLQTEQRGVRVFVLGELSQFGPELRPQVPALLKLVEDDDPQFRQLAVLTLGQVQAKTPEVRASLLKVLREDPEPLIRLAAADSHWKLFRDQMVPDELQKLLKAEPPIVRIRASQLLWWMNRNPKVLAGLQELAEKENQIGEIAMMALADLGPDAASSANVIAAHLVEPGRPQQAAMTLERFGPAAKKFLPQLTELSRKGGTPAIRLAATQAAWRVGGDPKSLDALKPLLEDKTLATRLDAARGLTNCAPLPKTIVPLAEKLLEAAEPQIRLFAAESLRDSESKDKALAALIKLLRDPQPEIRYQAAFLIGLYGSEGAAAVRELIRCLQDPNEDLHAMAAETLGRIGPAAKPAIPALLERLTMTNCLSRVYSATCEALGLIGPEASEAIPALKAKLTAPEGYVRVNAAYALWRIAQDKTGLAVLEAGLNHRNPATRGYAAEALWFLRKDPAGLAELIRMVDQVEGNTKNQRFIALRAFSRIGPDAKAAQPFVERELQSADRDLRMMAQEALRKVNPKK